MRKTMKNYMALALIIAAVMAVGTLVVLRGPEDDWICVNGQWTKHGAPAASMPNEPCNGKSAKDFLSCADSGYPVLESYPRQCKLPDGRTFVEDIGNELEKIDVIKIETPRPNQIVKAPIMINGRARGNWFFEAEFPVKLLDADGRLITTSVAHAKGEWMTEEFVPFEAELNFEFPATATGTLVLEKDNPSGLPQNADELKIPIKFIDGSN